MIENIIRIEELKKQMSNGNGRFEDGIALAEVGVSDLNSLFDITYKQAENWVKLKEFISQKANKNLITDEHWGLYQEIIDFMYHPLQIENNDGKVDISKIKRDLLEIINQNPVGACLCGHGESCDICSPSESYNKLSNGIRNYLKQL